MSWKTKRNSSSKEGEGEVNRYVPILLGVFGVVVLFFFFTPRLASEQIPPPALNASCAGFKHEVCGLNSVTYANECELIRAGITLYAYGACNSAIRCSKIQQTVCGADGKSYINACVATKLLKIPVAKYGPC
jgi:hypothetical protein